jgi:multiple sugar transport system permease protein
VWVTIDGVRSFFHSAAGIFAFTLARVGYFYALFLLGKLSVRTLPIGVVGELIRGDTFYLGQLIVGLVNRG